jgi:ribonuclease P protein component
VLPAPHRLTRGDDLRRVARSGRRCGTSTVVVHVLTPATDVGVPPRIGFVVSRAVGNAVVRHRVQRRLRHLVHDRLADLPSGSQVVVRALAPAAAASYAELGDDLDRCLHRALDDRRSDRSVRGQGSVS